VVGLTCGVTCNRCTAGRGVPDSGYNPIPMKPIPMKNRPAPITPQQYRALADFRYELRRFLRYSEQVTRKHGLTPLQYQLLLQIKGYPGRERATIGELAERLQAQHHGVVSLATRCESLGLIKRERGDTDRRVIYLTLSAKGNRAVERLAQAHRDELRTLQAQFMRIPWTPPDEV
jgi:DNA-binding MarR family transcriptional regulator